MIFCFVIPGIVFIGLCAYFLVESMLTWEFYDKSTLGEILLANFYSPIVLFVYAVCLWGAQEYTNERYYRSIFIGIIAICAVFVVMAAFNTIIKYRIAEETPDYAGFVVMCLLAIIFAVLGYLALFCDLNC